MSRDPESSTDVVSPLDGIRVVSVSDNLASALVSHFFADNGAEVINVERPDGHGARELPSHALLSRGTRSVTLDLKSPAGLARMRELATRADVLIETFRPGTTLSKTFDYEGLAIDNSRLIHLSITGWGRGNSYSHLKGYEHLVMAKLGLLHQMERIAPRPGPAYVTIPYGSVGAAHTGVIGILAALFEREGSGLGQHVEANLVQGLATLDTWAWWLQIVWDRYPGAFTPAALFSDDNKPAGFFAFQNLLAPTAHGEWLLFGMNRPHMLNAGIREMGLSDRLEEPSLANFPDVEDDDARNAMWLAMVNAVRHKSMEQWQAVFDRDHDLFAEEARTGDRVLEHPQFRHSDMSVTVDDPITGPVRQPGPIVRFPGYARTTYRASPPLGAHNAEHFGRPPADAPFPTASPSAGLPLTGVTVVEFGALFAGPYGATLLTDLGARVIKVEPLEGDPIRGMLGLPEIAGAKVMQGKESIALDAGTDEGRRIISQLISRADVVLQSFRPDAAKRMGVDADVLTAIKPDLVYLSAAAYGIDGPMASHPAFATTIAAAVGFARVNGGPVPEVSSSTPLDEVCPLSIRLSAAGAQMNVQADGLSALGNAAAMLLGLVAQRRGRPVPPMVTSMMGTSVYAISDHLLGETRGITADEDLFGIEATYRLYECRKGWIFLAAPTPDDWQLLSKALATEIDLDGDERFADRYSRELRQPELTGMLASAFIQRDAREWEALLTEHRVGCVEVEQRSPESRLMSEEFGRACGFVIDVTHPTFDKSPRLQPPLRFSRSSTRTLPGVLCGQHTDEILAGLGYQADEIADLRTRSIVA